MISVEHMDELITRFKSGELDIRDIIEQSYFGGRTDREKELSEWLNEYSENLWKTAYHRGKTNGAREFAEWLAEVSKVSEPIKEHTINRWLEDFAKWQEGHKHVDYKEILNEVLEQLRKRRDYYEGKNHEIFIEDSAIISIIESLMEEGDSK